MQTNSVLDVVAMQPCTVIRHHRYSNTSMASQSYHHHHQHQHHLHLVVSNLRPSLLKRESKNEAAMLSWTSNGRQVGRPKATLKRGKILCSGGHKDALRTPVIRSEDENVDDAAIDDALEALFLQLEQDLQEGDLAGRDSSYTATEEELVAFEQCFGGSDAEGDLSKMLKPLTKRPNQRHFTTSQKHKHRTPAKDSKRETSKQKDAETIRCLSVDSKVGPSKEKNAAAYQDRILGDTVGIVKTLPETEGKEEDVEEEDDNDEERVVQLEPWQLRKLVSAQEIGRRRVNIKSLAAELGLDRSDVLSFLRDPPPELLTAVLEDTPKEPDTNNSEGFDEISTPEVKNSLMKATEIKKGPHLKNPRDWHSQQRLRKEVVTTFERVYRRTKRPTNSMIQNMVELTHVPRRRIMKWFEDRRGQSVSKNVRALETLKG